MISYLEIPLVSFVATTREPISGINRNNMYTKAEIELGRVSIEFTTKSPNILPI